MYVGAFSSGLAETLRHNVEVYVDLDAMFFE